jgi:hypothetical protein
MPRASFEGRASAKATQAGPRDSGVPSLPSFASRDSGYFRLLSGARRDLARDDLNLGSNGPYGRLRRRNVAGRGDNTGRLSAAFVRADDGTRTHDLLHGKRLVDSGQGAPEVARLSRIASFCARCVLRADSRDLRSIQLGLGTGTAVVPNEFVAHRPLRARIVRSGSPKPSALGGLNGDSRRNGRPIRWSEPISPSQWISAWNLTSHVV